MMRNAERAHRKLLTALRSRDAKSARAAIAEEINLAATHFDAILAADGDR